MYGARSSTACGGTTTCPTWAPSLPPSFSGRSWWTSRSLLRGAASSVTRWASKLFILSQRGHACRLFGNCHKLSNEHAGIIVKCGKARKCTLGSKVGMQTLFLSLQIANPQILRSILLSQICKFIRGAITQISNPHSITVYGESANRNPQISLVFYSRNFKIRQFFPIGKRGWNSSFKNSVPGRPFDGKTN
jgi:hypothetical protein